jgi:hypothetical protein
MDYFVLILLIRGFLLSALVPETIRIPYAMDAFGQDPRCPLHRGRALGPFL